MSAQESSAEGWVPGRHNMANWHDVADASVEQVEIPTYVIECGLCDHAWFPSASTWEDKIPTPQRCQNCGAFLRYPFPDDPNQDTEGSNVTSQDSDEK